MHSNTNILRNQMLQYEDIPDRLKILQDSYKIIVILFVIQIIFHAMQPDKDFLMKALNGDILNDNLLILIIVILIGISSYYLVFNELLELN